MKYKKSIKEITRTIKFITPDDDKRNPVDVVQTVLFERQVGYDEETGTILEKSPWVSEDDDNYFEDYETQDISGLVPDISYVPAKEVSPDDEDIVVTITYSDINATSKKGDIAARSEIARNARKKRVNNKSKNTSSDDKEKEARAAFEKELRVKLEDFLSDVDNRRTDSKESMDQDTDSASSSVESETTNLSEYKSETDTSSESSDYSETTSLSESYSHSESESISDELENPESDYSEETTESTSISESVSGSNSANTSLARVIEPGNNDQEDDGITDAFLGNDKTSPDDDLTSDELGPDDFIKVEPKKLKRLEIRTELITPIKVSPEYVKYTRGILTKEVLRKLVIKGEIKLEAGVFVVYDY